jgi:hypothetical protein
VARPPARPGRATAEHWEHRAHQLETARPRLGDHHGHATHDDLTAAHARLTRDAANCRHHAALIRETGLDAEARTAIAQVLLERQVA